VSGDVLLQQVEHLDEDRIAERVHAAPSDTSGANRTAAPHHRGKAQQSPQ
jgi:hypothetical protein